MRCPSCGKENPAGFAFCGFCTAPLEEPAALGEERKIVTVLFVDLVGFTARSDAADPEDVRARIRPYHQRLRREIERFGGTVEKFVGDAVMAVFGAPIAHEDDAERAVRAGLRILEAIEELNETDPDLELQVRVGINTGEALVTLGARPEQGEGIVTGDVVNTASRLQSAAPVGGIAVGEDTHRATKEVFGYEALEPVQLKGKPEPVAIWRPTAARARLGADVARSHTTPLVGREVERTLLQGTYDRALKDASVQLVTIIGEPGMGKSRLVAELLAYVDDLPALTRWRQGRCLPYGEGITFWALGEIVKAEAGILESDTPEAVAAKLDAVVPGDERDREWLEARLGPLVGLESGPAAPREEAFTAWRRFLEGIASSRPTVLVFEDLHWADDALLDFLEYLADWAEGVPMLLLCTARPELYERQPTWAGGKRNATTVNLAPLSDEETGRLISALLDAAVLPSEVQALVLERAGGNPLYAEEFVRMLRDRDLLVRRGRTLQLREGADVPFPDSVQALIAARLDTLSPERKRLLQDAAVIGKVFWTGAVAQMGERDERDVRDGLHELSRKELVRTARSSSMEGEFEYSFWHALVRDVCYGQIPRASRAAKHVQAARWIEEQVPERMEDLADVLAHHYLQAIELTSAAGQSDEATELEAAAVRFLLLSGDRSLGLDVARADADYGRALELTPPGHRQRATVLARLGDALEESGRHAEAGAALEEAIADFEARGDRPASGRTASRYARVLYAMGDARWEAVLAQGVALLESDPPGPELVEAYAGTASMRHILGRNHEAVEYADRALALAAELGLAEPANALGFRGAARCQFGDAGGLEDFARALELAQERGLGRSASAMYNNFAEALWPVEGPAHALEVMRAGVEFAERRGLHSVATHTASSTLNPLYELGEWDEATELAERLSERAEATVAVLSWVRGMQARLFVQRGQLEQAGAAAGSAVAGARQGGENWQMGAAFSAAAVVHLARGEPNRALALLAELATVSSNPFYVACLPAIVRTAVACGDRELAKRLTEGVKPLFPLHEHALEAARATLAEAGGELEHAAGLYGEAADRWRSFGNVPERGYALLGQGRSLLGLGRPGAESALREAQEIFGRLGARPLFEETDALLGRASVAAS